MIQLIKEAAAEQSGDLEAISAVGVREEADELAEICVEKVVKVNEVSAPIKLNALC